MRTIAFAALALVASACSAPEGVDGTKKTTTGSNGPDVTNPAGNGGETDASVEVAAFIDDAPISCQVNLDTLVAGDTDEMIEVQSGSYDLTLGTYLETTHDGLPIHMENGDPYTRGNESIDVPPGANKFEVGLNRYFEWGPTTCTSTLPDGREFEWELDRFAVDNGSMVDLSTVFGDDVTVRTSGTSLVMTGSISGFIGNPVITSSTIENDVITFVFDSDEESFPELFTCHKSN